MSVRWPRSRKNSVQQEKNSVEWLTGWVIQFFCDCISQLWGSLYAMLTWCEILSTEHSQHSPEGGLDTPVVPLTICLITTEHTPGEWEHWISSWMEEMGMNLTHFYPHCMADRLRRPQTGNYWRFQATERGYE